MSANLATSNGTKQVTLPPNVPATLSVSVNGAIITAPAIPSRGGNVYFKANKKGLIADESVSFEDAILSTEVLFNGETLPLAQRNADAKGNAQVHISEPRKYDKGHEKAGQIVPGTGGNTALSYWLIIPSWGESGYSLRVTLTGVTDDAGNRFVKVAVHSMKVAGGFGTVEGELSF